jgi:hypothetical protein
MSRQSLKLFAAGIIIIGGMVASTILVHGHTQRPRLNDSLYLPSGKFIGEMSLGYQQLAADLVWLSAVQYYGDYRLDKHDLSYFEGLIDIIITLDPHFIFAYIFGALVVSSDIGSLENGVEILKKGMMHNPGSWKLPFEIGFLYYVGAANADLAARYFDLASRIPGSPEMAERFAAFVYSKAGHTQTSIRMWEELAENSDEPYMKELAERYIEKLKQQLQEETDS